MSNNTGMPTIANRFRRRIEAPRVKFPAGSDSQLFHFFVVILAVEDVPLLGAFEDSALLAFDLQAGGLIDSLLVVEEVFENLAGFLANGVGVFDEVDLIHLFEGVGDGPRQHIHFVAAQSHRTALYLRTSSL